MSDAPDGFLSRWARRKARVQQGIDEPAEAPAVAPPPVAASLPAESPQPASMAAAATPEVESVPLPTMEDVANLTRSSDYSRFVATGVDRGVSNAAMRKLFSDPHFNVMDGLDTYIDDYGKADPIPESMLRQMNQSKFLRLFDDDEEDADKADNAESVPAIAAVAATTPAASSLPDDSTQPAPEPRPDDDPDLRLQQDDVPGRSGAAPDPGR